MNVNPKFDIGGSNSNCTCSCEICFEMSLVIPPLAQLEMYLYIVGVGVLQTNKLFDFANSGDV